MPHVSKYVKYVTYSRALRFDLPTEPTGSQLVEPVTEQAAKAAAQLLKGAGPHSHKYAIAIVAEVALRQPKPSPC